MLPLKISLSGSGCIGKSTLARTLAEKFSLTLIEENFDPMFDGATFSAGADKFAEALFTILHNKSVLEDKAEFFVTDTCPLDLLMAWFSRQLHVETNRTEEFFKACKPRLIQYDFVVIPPWGGIPLNQENAVSGRLARNTNPFVQLRTHATVVGFTHIWIDKRKIIEIPRALKDHNKRIELIIRAMSQRRPDLEWSDYIVKNPVIE